MARINIFELLAQQNNLEQDVIRLTTLFEEWNFADREWMGSDTLRDFVDKYCFETWKNRGRCISVDDFLESIGYDDLVIAAATDIDAFLTVIEVIYNFWMLGSLYAKSHGIKLYNTEKQLHELMDNCLSEYNHCIVFDKKNYRVFVVEKDPAVTAAAEISQPEIALDIFKYNHRSLQGDVKSKWAILALLGKDLEGKRTRIERIDSALSKHIFILLNNLDIRHNNVTEGTSKYKKYVATMNASQLEEWYDKLYQMMLLAILELEQDDREAEIRELESHFEKRE